MVYFVQEVYESEASNPSSKSAFAKQMRKLKVLIKSARRVKIPPCALTHIGIFAEIFLVAKGEDMCYTL